MSVQSGALAAMRRQTQPSFPLSDDALYWRTLMDVSSDAIIVLTMDDCRVARASRSFAQMLGYSMGEIEGMTPWDWQTALTREQVVGPRSSTATLQFVTTMRHKDGTLLDVEIDVFWGAGQGQGLSFWMAREVSERKPAERALDDETALRQLAIESSRDGIVIVSMDDFSVVSANKAFADLLGRDPEHMAGLHPWDWDVRFSKAELLGLGAEANALGIERSVQIETMFRRHDGSVLDVEVSVSYFETNGRRYAYCVGRDVTKRKGAEQALAAEAEQLRQAQVSLKHSEARWNFALESAGQGVWDCDVPNNTVYYSLIWKLMRGYDADEVVDSSFEAWLQRVHPDDRDHVLEQMRRQNSGELSQYGFEYRERHKAGHYIWILSLGAAVEWTSEGLPKRMVGTDTDITQKKLAEQEVLELSRRLDRAMESSLDGVVITALDTMAVLQANRAFAQLLQRPADEVVGMYPWNWDAKTSKDDIIALIQGIGGASVDNFFIYETLLRREDSSLIEVEVNLSFFDIGEQRYCYSTIRDVTERNRTKQALREETESLQAAKDLAEARNVELEAVKARIESQALHDALTGLPNRRYLDELLGQHANRVRASGQGGGLALLHIDLDRFKQINDTLGHGAGDAMLVHVAALLRASVGVEHFVARVGGDEFVIVCLNEADAGRLSNLADRITAQVRQPIAYHGHTCRIGASIGIAIETGTEIDVQRVLINADVALYRAKGRGRNRHEFFSKALQDEITSTKRIADEILGGIEQNEFLPYYQPLVDANTFDIAGVEALVRWRHPTAGMLGPDRFLKIAEDLNVVGSIDRIILEQAIRDLDHWSARGLAVPSVSVNVSFRRLNDEQLVPSLRALQIRPGAVSFELLESIFLDEFDDLVARNIDGIKQLGIGIDVDDFGTGHTSIVSLLNLNPRRFKIDRQLIGPIARAPEQRRLIASIIDIGKSLGIKVVAEGVETMEQARILRDLGCDVLQGYAFARPMPAERLIEWVGAGAWRHAS